MRLLAERGWSLRRLAAEATVDVAHLSRVLRGEKPPSSSLIERVQTALDLPADYFPEAREAELIAAIRRDPKLRDRLYGQVHKRAPRK